MKICSHHKNYKVPLIWTFAWNGYECWCPYCDGHWDMFGSGMKTQETEELKNRLELYKEATAEYRGARGTLICEKTMWKKEYIKPSELPKEEIERLNKIVEKGWKLNIKIEDLK